jgi:hypothetical protein
MLFIDKKQIELNTKPLFPKWKILVDDDVHEVITRINSPI